MPQSRTRRKARAGNPSTRLDLATVAPRPAAKPVRGLKVKTVSALTLAFSLLCLAAFAAGLPPLPVGRSTASERPAIAKHAKAAARRAPTTPFGAPPTAR
jgi:hypothetical protein